jgi:hypothetical protein
VLVESEDGQPEQGQSLSKGNRIQRGPKWRCEGAARFVPFEPVTAVFMFWQSSCGLLQSFGKESTLIIDPYLQDIVDLCDFFLRLCEYVKGLLRAALSD